MELKIWVEGIQRIVCGVNETTTCQDVVFALAHATGKTGRFTLLERWRNNERPLAPHEHPLKILMKWGEYSSDVQFILQRSGEQKALPQQPQSGRTDVNRNAFAMSKSNPASPVTSPVAELYKRGEHVSSLERNKETRKSLGAGEGGTRMAENVGIVKGVPQKSPSMGTVTQLKYQQGAAAGSATVGAILVNNNSDYATKVRPMEFSPTDVRNALDRRTSGGATNKTPSNENLLDLYRNNSPSVSSNGSLVPPPYRDPPPPSRGAPAAEKKLEEHLDSTQYRDLVQLIQFQRDKINMQQADLNKFDAEIVHLESRNREQLAQLEAITAEIAKTDQLFRQGGEQLQTLQYVEEENELVRQQEKTLKSEITLLRSKLANCETELLQCKNKIRLLMDEISVEQRQISRQQSDGRAQLERHLLGEVERIQAEIDMAIQNTELSSKAADSLKKEISVIELAIAEKKSQVEQLVNEMKEVNLQSLAVAPADEVRHLLESSLKPGSTRRIIGSPRQLETAVPTSKNPHGVWV